MHSRKRLVRNRPRQSKRPTDWSEFLRNWFISPGLWALLRNAKDRTLRPIYPTLAPPPKKSATPLPEIRFCKGSQFWWVPLENIVNSVGQAFTSEQHHYLRYLGSGLEALRGFYQAHQPTSTLESRFVYEPFPGITSAIWTEPWAPFHQPETVCLEPSPENYGPVSELELHTEAARLDLVRHSIEKYGFIEGVAARHQIHGQLLLHDNGDFRIMIAGGNHRTAVLAHLGWRLIPIYPLAGYPHVDIRDLEEWPGVVAGNFTPRAARAVFETMFRSGQEQLLPGW